MWTPSLQGHADLVERVEQALRRYFMSGHYYVEWVKRSWQVCEVRQVKVKLYPWCPSVRDRPSWKWRQWLWAVEKEESKCGRRTKTDRSQRKKYRTEWERERERDRQKEGGGRIDQSSSHKANYWPVALTRLLKKQHQSYFIYENLPSPTHVPDHPLFPF